jgi:phosphatidylinositol alpha 1,6-mannosyltransferase
VRFAIVGDGPALPSVTRRLRGMPVVWLGRLSGRQLADAYAAFDLFVHTGTEETFGQTLQEAGATGIPVVAPRAGGPIDIVDHGVTGLLFDPGAPGDFRSAVAALTSDAGRRARFGESGRRRMLSRSWDAVCGELVDHYLSVLGTPIPTADAVPTAR